MCKTDMLCFSALVGLMVLVMASDAKAQSYYVPPADKYPVSALFAQDQIDFKTGKLKPGDPDFERIQRHLNRPSSNKEEWRMVGSCIAKFQNNEKSDLPPSECDEEKLEIILVAEDYAITGKGQEKLVLSKDQRFGKFFQQSHDLVSLGGFRVFDNPKNGFYFIRTTSGSMQEKPKILIYRGGDLSKGYEFASTDMATYIGKMEYRMWDSNSVELLDVYELE